MTTLFADVILPLPLPNFYTYRVPLELNEYMKVGSRVVVQFGKKKVLTAIVAQLHEVPPKLYEAKSILSLLDEYPILNSIQLDFYYWIASYYMSHKGEVINAALPSGLKISSESRIQLNPTYRYDVELSESEKLLIDELKARDSMTYAEAADCLEVKSIYLVISSLIKKGAVLIYEEIREKYKQIGRAHV